MSDLDQIQKFELQTVKNLTKLLRDQLEGRSLADRFKSCKERGEKATQAEERSRETHMQFCTSVYITGLQALADDKSKEFRRMLKRSGIKPKRSTHPFVPLAQLQLGKNNREKASRISSGLRFAAFQEVRPEDLAAFIKKHHGISGCAECWRKLRNEKAASQDDMGLKQEGATEPEEKESEKTEDESDNTRLAFKEDSKEDFAKLLAKEENIFLRLRASLSWKGLLTITKVSVDQHKTEHRKKKLKDVRKLTKRSRVS